VSVRLYLTMNHLLQVTNLSLIAGNKPVVTDRDCNITRAFHEASNYDMMDDLDEYYDGI